MEKPPLEKVIERLEKLDVREWTENNKGHFITRISGLKIHLHVFKDLGITNTYLHIQSEDESKEICYNSKYKTEIKKFYETIRKKYDELKEREFKERLGSFLSE